MLTKCAGDGLGHLCELICLLGLMEFNDGNAWCLQEGAEGKVQWGDRIEFSQGTNVGVPNGGAQLLSRRALDSLSAAVKSALYTKQAEQKVGSCPPPCPNVSASLCYPAGNSGASPNNSVPQRFRRFGGISQVTA